MEFSLLKRFLYHLKETYLEAGDRFDNAMRILTALLTSGMILSNLVAPHVGFLSILEDPALKGLFEIGLIVVLVFWGVFWVPFKKCEALRAELHELKRKRQGRHELAKLLERLEKEITRIQNVPVIEWVENQGNPASIVVEVCKALDKHVGPGESDLMLSQTDQKWTPVEPVTGASVPDYIKSLHSEASLTKQRWIDNLTNHARHLKKIVEQMRPSISD